ncbi:MAG: hypothetical protein OCD76_05340 [Reichenbachiella sp.]
MNAHSNNKVKKSVNLIDRACQKANTIVEEISIHSDIKRRMWSSINQKLENINKRVLSWFLLSATSISLLVAAHITMDTIYDIDQNTPTPTQFHSTLVTDQFVIKKEVVALEKIKHKELITINPLRNEIPTSLSSREYMYCQQEKTNLEYQTSFLKYKADKRIEITTGVLISELNIQPEIALNFKIFDFGNDKYSNKIYAGISASFAKNKSSNTNDGQIVSKKISYLPAVFAQSIFERKNNKNDSVWTGKIGYLLNQSAQSVFKKNTIKIGVQKNIGKHIKIGPEVIITNNFNSYLPGIGITVTS